MGTTADKLNAILASKEAIRTAIVDKGVDCDTTVPLADYAGKIGDISGGGGVPVIPAPTGDFYAAIAYFTGENGDYGNYAYAYANNSTEFNAQFLHTTVFANFALHPAAGSATSITIPASKMFGFYFGNQFDLTFFNSGFLAYCYSFNQPLTIPNGITNLGNSFLHNCQTFNQPLTIPSSVTSIGNYFLYQCYSFSQPLTIPSSVTSIGNLFVYNCYSFNQPLTIPSSVTSIGNYFLYQCYSFSQPLTIPSSVTSIGNYFMNNCQTFNRLIVDTSAIPTPINNYSLSANSNIAAMYVNGITVTGAGASAWIAALPNITFNPYRKLILG
jgi:hypothetical protein